jgi:hypothetical protein
MSDLPAPRDVIVVDMDGTVADCAHRIHLAQDKDWEGFHELAKEDKPHEDVLAFLRTLREPEAFAFFTFVICTGRNEAWRGATREWLMAHDVPFDVILMRPDGDYSRDGELKVRLLTEHFGSLERAKERVLMILEDRDTAIEGLRDAGFPVWQVRPSGY